MPIQLTTALDMGAVDDDYTHVKIMEFTHDALESAILLTVQHGTLSGQTFVRGKKIPNTTQKTFKVTGQDYTDLVAELPANTTETLYAQVAKALYQWLIDNGHYAGTIV